MSPSVAVRTFQKAAKTLAHNGTYWAAIRTVHNAGYGWTLNVVAMHEVSHECRFDFRLLC